MLSFRFFLLNTVMCVLACSLLYFMPDLQTRLFDSEYFVKLRAYFPSINDEEVKHEFVWPTESDTQSSGARSSRETDENTRKSDGKIVKSEDGNGSSREEELHRTLAGDELPVYPAYSELDTYMLSMMISEEEMPARSDGMQNHAFNEFVSEKIGFHRNIPDERIEVCKSQNYPRELPVASVVICFYNEAWSTLLRSVHSILDKTPPALVKEILLVDDSSSLDHLKTALDTYISQHLPKVRLIRSKERLGLIRARMLGAKHATGDVLVFLDSHIEVNVAWLEPLLARIHQDRTAVVVPFVDTIDAETFVYTPSPLVRGGFTWSLLHNWDPLPESFTPHNKLVSAEPIE